MRIAPPVHPHARGEYLSSKIRILGQYGSPPRTWGILRFGGVNDSNQRFTPTHVGNTGGSDSLRPAAPVHPHARGEYVRLTYSFGRLRGSPPRTWGIRPGGPAGRRRRRFTPTHVGNTSTVRKGSFIEAVHPHARGEYAIGQYHRGKPRGSPPRTWGIPALAGFADVNHRFTPTHVGNTSRCSRMGRLSAVHPHARGEYVPAHHHVVHDLGSPPRTWGIRCDIRRDGRRRRFTPTHVGNTSASRTVPSQSSVHPHARGEYSGSRRKRLPELGSPPRTWGIRTNP